MTIFLKTFVSFKGESGWRGRRWDWPTWIGETEKPGCLCVFLRLCVFHCLYVLPWPLCFICLCVLFLFYFFFVFAFFDCLCVFLFLLFLL